MNTDKLNTACATALTSIAEFEAAWIHQLPPERLKQLHDMTSKGVKIGFLVVGHHSAQILAVDSAGGWVTLEDIQIQTATSH